MERLHQLCRDAFQGRRIEHAAAGPGGPARGQALGRG
jgi:hypothetical protein